MYSKTEWKDHIVDESGQVVQQGTPVNASNLNKIENGIEEIGNISTKVNLLDNPFFTINTKQGKIALAGVHKYSNESFSEDLGAIENTVAVAFVKDGVYSDGTYYYKAADVADGYVGECEAVDAWIIKNGFAVVTSNGLNVSWDGVSESMFLLEQMLVDYSRLIGNTVTVSIVYEGDIYSHTFTNVEDNVQTSFDFGNGLICALNFESAWGKRRPLQVLTNSTSPKLIGAVKLEIGSVSTLSNDSVPNYSQEYTKCMPKIVTGTEDLNDGETYEEIAPNSLYVFYEE